MKLQRGQSMVEFAIGCAVMALLLLGSLTIAGYQQVQRRAATSAREAAFQGAWIGARADRAAALRQIAWSRFDDPALVDATGRAAYVGKDDVAVAVSMNKSPVWRTRLLPPWWHRCMRLVASLAGALIFPTTVSSRVPSVWIWPRTRICLRHLPA